MILKLEQRKNYEESGDRDPTQREIDDAKNRLKWLKSQRPNDSKVDILPVALLRCGRLAAQILIGEIERNQLKDMSPKNKIWLADFKAKHQLTALNV